MQRKSKEVKWSKVDLQKKILEEDTKFEEAEGNWIEGNEKSIDWEKNNVCQKRIQRTNKVFEVNFFLMNLKILQLYWLNRDEIKSKKIKK